MKAFRTTFYAPPGPSPRRLGMFGRLTAVVSEKDAVRSFDELRGEAAKNSEGTYVATDVFEVRDGAEPVEVTMTAAQRAKAFQKAEQGRAVAYYWIAQHLPPLKAGGMFAITRPTPLTVEECRDVLWQVSYHPNYKSHYLLLISQDGLPVAMKDGWTVILPSKVRDMVESKGDQDVEASRPEDQLVVDEIDKALRGQRKAA